MCPYLFFGFISHFPSSSSFLFCQQVFLSSLLCFSLISRLYSASEAVLTLSSSEAPFSDPTGICFSVGWWERAGGGDETEKPLHHTALYFWQTQICGTFLKALRPIPSSIIGFSSFLNLCKGMIQLHLQLLQGEKHIWFVGLSFRFVWCTLTWERGHLVVSTAAVMTSFPDGCRQFVHSLSIPYSINQPINRSCHTNRIRVPPLGSCSVTDIDKQG